MTTFRNLTSDEELNILSKVADFKLRKWLWNSTDSRDLALLLIRLTGMQGWEACSLNATSLKLNRFGFGCIAIPKGHTGKSRTIPVNTTLKPLVEFLSTTDCDSQAGVLPLFTDSNVVRLNPITLAQRLKGLMHTLEITEPLTLCRIRNTFFAESILIGLEKDRSFLPNIGKSELQAMIRRFTYAGCPQRSIVPHYYERMFNDRSQRGEGGSDAG